MVFADPLPLIHQFLVHHGYLACRPSEADKPELEPVAKSLPKRGMIGFVTIHSFSPLMFYLHKTSRISTFPFQAMTYHLLPTSLCLTECPPALWLPPCICHPSCRGHGRPPPFF